MKRLFKNIKQFFNGLIAAREDSSFRKEIKNLINKK